MAVKLLCDPVYSLRDTNKCIAHFSVDECARHVLKTYPDSFVYYISPTTCPVSREVVPEETDEEENRFVFVKDLERDFPGRVKYWPGVYYTNNRMYQILWKPEWYQNLLSGGGFAWDWDILLTMRGTIATDVRWWNFSASQQSKKIVIQDHFPVFDFKNGAKVYYSRNKALQLNPLSSYTLADRVVVGAQYEVESVMKVARSYLSPASCKRLQNNISAGFVTPRGLDLNFPLKKKGKKKGDKLVGIFTQRIGMAGRHPFEVLDTFFYSFVRRKKGSVEFQISTNSMFDFNEKSFNKYKFVSFYRSTREQFYERLRGSDFCISFSTTEGMPTSILEAICWGCIPILLRYDWSIDMAGRDYPFLFNNLTEAVSMVERVLTRPDECFVSYQKWYKDYFLNYLKRSGTLTRALDEVIKENIAEVDHFATKKMVRPVYDDMVQYVQKRGMKRFTFLDLVIKMREEGLLRANPKLYGIGKSTQAQIGWIVPPRMPDYYRQLHCLLKKTGWKRGLEVGEIIIPKGE